MKRKSPRIYHSYSPLFPFFTLSFFLYSFYPRDLPTPTPTTHDPRHLATLFFLISEIENFLLSGLKFKTLDYLKELLIPSKPQGTYLA